MRKEKAREGNGERTERREREEMVGQRLVYHLKKKRHTQEKDVQYESNREGGERERQ